MANIFEASQFVGTKWDSADVKAKFANDLAKFVLSGFDEERFTQSLYRRLSLTFGHIAHYDKYGFWHTWFLTPQKCVRWVDYILEHVIYGDPEYTYSDVERAFKKWLQTADLGELRQLAGKQLWEGGLPAPCAN